MQEDQPHAGGSAAPLNGNAGRLISPFTWGIVIIFAVAVILAVAVPHLIRSREVASPNACINNLRYIDGAKQQWALEHRKADSDVPTLTDIAPYMSPRNPPQATNMACPAGGAAPTFDSCYEIGAVTNLPKCKIMPDSHVLRGK